MLINQDTAQYRGAMAAHQGTFTTSVTLSPVEGSRTGGILPRRAFRRSCDRCHAQKIKCTGNKEVTARAPCQRCQQAGLRCVYSERCPKRKLRQSRAADLVSADPDPCLHMSSPPVPSQSLPLDVSESHSSNTSRQFLDPPDSYDWSWTSIGTDEAIDTDCWGLSQCDGGFSCQLEPTLPDLPSPFESTVEKAPLPPVSSDIARAASAQRELFDDLSAVSQELEAILLAVTVEWPKQEIWTRASPHSPTAFPERITQRRHNMWANWLTDLHVFSLDPIGMFFNASRRLLTVLRQQAHADCHQGTLDECLRTKNLFTAVHCYILNVRILTSISELLLSQIRRTQNSHMNPWEGSRSESPSRDDTSSSSGHSSVDTIPDFSENLPIGELFSYVDPLTHALFSACTTLHVGVQLLRENEITLGVHSAQGIAASISMSGGPGEDIARTGATNSARCEEQPTTPAARVLFMFLSDEGASQEVKSAGSRGRTIAALRRCYEDIFSLARKHKHGMLRDLNNIPP